MSDTRKHQDLFTPDEAATYLHLPSVESLRTLREKGLLVGHSGWTTYLIYHREDLDACALRMCGRGHAVKAKTMQLARHG